MQNKKSIIILSILVIVVGVAAFIGGRLLNQRAGPLGLAGLLPGKGGMVSVSVQLIPAKELPTTKPETTGLFVERKDNSIVVASASSVSMKPSGGGVVVQVGGGDSGPSTSGGPSSDGPKVEIVITNETTIYLETTSGPPPSGGNVVLQQTVKKGTLDDLTTQSFVTVWGRKSGDRIIAETLLISNPVMFKRP